MFLKQDSNFILQAKLINPVIVSQLEISVTYKDNTNADYSDVIVATNNTAVVTLLAAPPAKTVNLVELIKIYNPDTQANTIQILAGSNVVYTCTVGSKDSVILSDANISNGLGFMPLAADGNGSKLTNLNASNISTGTLGTNYGGAGAINGILKADGSGNVSQAMAETDYKTTTVYAANLFSGSTENSADTITAYTPVSLASSGWTSNINTGFSHANGVLTCIMPGTYLINYQAVITSSISTLAYIGISVNTSLYSHFVKASATSIGAYYNLASSYIQYFNAGDTLAMTGWLGAVGTLTYVYSNLTAIKL